MEDSKNVDIYNGFKPKLIMHYLEIRVERLSQEQKNALYKRLLEVEGGNIIVPEADNGLDAISKPTER